ncbi:MAG: right-handed parallel beta-helix repeat-containing protein [Planctomycetota bacterium]
MRSIVAAALIVVITGMCSAALSGPLTPPPGPVSETGKTLDNLLPSTPLSQDTTPGNSGFSVFTISAPGRYHLTGDLVVPAGLQAILIGLPGDSRGRVEIDLAGFEIDARSEPNRQIVGGNSAGSRVEIHHGTLRGGFAGIDVSSALYVHDVDFEGVGSPGRSAIAPNFPSIIERCRFTDLPGSGISQSGLAGDETIVRDCSFANIESFAILLEESATIERVSVSRTNSTSGAAIFTRNSAIIRDVQIKTAFGRALVVGSESIVSGLTVEGVSAPGVAEYGVTLGANSRMTDSVVDNYAGALGAILARRNVTIDGVTVNNSNGFGIFASEASITLVNSFIDDTQGAAVSLAQYNTIVNNSIEARNSNAPALVVGSHSRVDSNRFFGDLTITGTENLVVRNFFDFGDIDLRPGASLNDVGPLNDLANPWANFDR